MTTFIIQTNTNDGNEACEEIRKGSGLDARDLPAVTSPKTGGPVSRCMESAPHTTFEAEAELIERMHGHDAGALAELFDRYGRLVYSVILRVVHDASMAEDLTQETFLRVWNRVRGFDAGKGKGSIGPWLLAIAHNCAIDYLRSAGGRPRNVVNFEDAEHPALQTDMEREILGSEQARQLKRAVEKLCPNQRQAIELSYFGGLSQLEVAQRMGHPLGTVKTWVRKALQNLRADLGSPACVDVG